MGFDKSIKKLIHSLDSEIKFKPADGQYYLSSSSRDARAYPRKFRAWEARVRTRIEMLIDPFFYTDNVKRNFQ